MLWAVIFTVSPMVLAAQGIFSPYTIQGIGEVQSNALINNIGSGGVGIANGQAWHLNTLNPALLPQNTFTVFGMGMDVDVRNISGIAGSQQNTSGELSYVNLGIPLKVTKWTMAVGVRPYSTVNYQVLTVDSTSFTDTRITSVFEGEGGLTDLNLAMGYKLFEGVAIGGRGSFLFGPITREATIIADNAVSNQQALIDQVTVSDLQFGGGLSLYKILYDKTASKDSTKTGDAVVLRPKWRINAGLTYDLQADLAGKRFRASENRNQFDRVISSDTILLDAPGSLFIPGKVGIGIGVERVNIWSLELNYTRQNWSQYRNFDGNTTSLNDSRIWRMGGSFTPDYQSVTSYFSRVTYRLGAKFERTPYLIGSTAIDDFGINFGMTLPLKGLSSLDMAFQYGTRGESTPGIVKEDYFKVYLGVTLNDVPWKKRPIYN